MKATILWSYHIFISQTKYARNLLKKFTMNSAKHVRTPMSATTKLSLDSEGKDGNQTLYCNMIGSLLYLTMSELDITFSVGVCARYQSKPKESHLVIVKRIMRCVCATIDYGIWHIVDNNTYIVEFSDADWAGCVDDRKSTSGGLFLCW